MMTVFVHWIAGCNRNQLNKHQMCHYEHPKDPRMETMTLVHPVAINGMTGSNEIKKPGLLRAS
jgi:hypothetical protein